MQRKFSQPTQAVHGHSWQVCFHLVNMTCHLVFFSETIAKSSPLNQKREIAFQSPAFGRIKKRWKMSGNIFSVSIIRTLDGVPKWLPHEVGKDEHWKLSLLMMSQLLLLLWMLRIMMLENLSLLLLLLLMLLLMTRPRLRCHIKTEISKFVWPGTNILYKLGQ